MPVVSLLNQKGGVGKSSITSHMGGVLASLGYRVLWLDNDPQANLTKGVFGPALVRSLDPSQTIVSIYRGDDPHPEAVIRPTPFERVDIVPGSRFLTTFNGGDLPSAPYEVQVCLREFLVGVADRYDLVLIDNNPTAQVCSLAALVASDGLIIPMHPEDYGAQGIEEIQQFIAVVRASHNPGLAITGIVVSMCERKSLHKVYEAKIRAGFEGLVFDTVIPRSIDYPEAVSHRKTVHAYKPRGKATAAMRALADEVLLRLGMASATPKTEAA